MFRIQDSLHTRTGQLHHRIEAIRLALAQTPLTDEVRDVLVEHLRVAEEALELAEAESPSARDTG